MIDIVPELIVLIWFIAYFIDQGYSGIENNSELDITMYLDDLVIKHGRVSS